MRRQILHDDQRLRLVEMVNSRHRARAGPALLPDQRMVLEERTLERQRPALADQPDIGQRLLGDDAADRAFDDEDQVQIAVSDLADGP